MLSATGNQRKRWLTVLALVALAAAIYANRAGAVTVYGPFDAFDDGSSPLGSVAINQTTGNIYVVDDGREKVSIFGENEDELPPLEGSATPSGSFSFSEPTSVLVDNSGGPDDGDVFVADTGHNVVDIFSSTGAYKGRLTGSATPPGAFSHPSGLAIDSNGDLFVADLKHKAIDKFEIGATPVSDADYVSRFTAPQMPSPGAIGFDAADNLYVSNYHINFVKFDSSGTFLETIGPAGATTEVRIDPINEWAFFAVEEHVYITHLNGEPIDNFYTYGHVYGVAENYTSKLVYIGIDGGYLGVDRPIFNLPDSTTGTATNIRGNSAEVSGILNGEGGGETTCRFAYSTSLGSLFAYDRSVECDQGPFNDSVDHAVTAKLTGLEPGTTYHFALGAANENGSHLGEDVTFTTPIAVHDLVTEAAENVTGTSATLKASFTGNNEDTHYYFEWGQNTGYGRKTSEPPGEDAGSPASGTVPLSAPLTGLEPGTTYHFRIVANNSNGTTHGGDREFTTAPRPPAASIRAVRVHSDSAEFEGSVSPHGLETSYFLEYGPADCAGGGCATSTTTTVLPLPAVRDVAIRVEGLTPDAPYHFRLVAENAAGPMATADQTIHTFPRLELLTDPCANAQVRKQTGAAQLLDCRAYELVSAASAGGYDVESDLAPDQDPYEGFPEASEPSKVLYTVHSGSIPGTGTPTNFSLDPYVATRQADGWHTEYVGYPAQGLVANGSPFGSPVAEADQTLNSFAFGGEGLCSPCFPNGSTGIPIRLPNGSLVQGMAGSLDPGPSATPAGLVAKHFSADGSHFIFGSKAKFEPDGNSNGDVSIYDRELPAGATHVVSKMPGGATMTGSGISELDVSADGSRILIGQKVGSDAGGNPLYHLYMNVGDAEKTIDLTPDAASGVIYDGMTADGTVGYFGTTDALTSDDHDTSADIYRVDVTESSASLTRVSTGSGSGDTNACNPTGGWNSASGGANCDTVAIAGGGGVAAADGSIYFLSPEKLDGPSHGEAGEPNLYVAEPGGAPHFVATLSLGDPVVTHAVSQPYTHSWGDFQVVPSGQFSTFVSAASLTGFYNEGFQEVFRYDGSLDCVSCATTNVIPTSDASLPSHGLGISDDGRVFFSSGEALAPGDNDGTEADAYEWEKGGVDLISSGISPHESGIFSISRSGMDAFFFTRDSLVGTDQNGQLMKIYDAREGGGFLLNPPPVPCQASDECHGPGTQSPSPPDIGTYLGTGGNAEPEKKKPRKHHPPKRRHHKPHHHRGAHRGSHWRSGR